MKKSVDKGKILEEQKKMLEKSSDKSSGKNIEKRSEKKTRKKPSKKKRISSEKTKKTLGKNNRFRKVVKNSSSKDIVAENKSKKKKIAKPVKEKAVKNKVSKKSGKEKSSKRKMLRVSTGLAGLDKLIEGGFKKNSTNLVMGDVGTGKSILATQFLVEGMKKGEKGLYVAFEEDKESFYNNMLSFGWDLAKYEQRGLFIYLEETPARVNTMIEEGGGSIESIILKNKITRLVIDSISSFALLFKNEMAKRNAALALFDMLGNWDCTSVLTIQNQPLKTKNAPKTIEFGADSLISLYFNRVGRERKRFLEILKMRGTKHSKLMHGFRIGKGGIFLDRGSDSRQLKSG